MLLPERLSPMLPSDSVSLPYKRVLGTWVVGLFAYVGPWPLFVGLSYGISFFHFILFRTSLTWVFLLIAIV
jgi:hypothetical protein